MFYKRKGLPEVEEIVLCKVTKIFPNSVFVDLLEFNDSGMVHISEVSPGRIRNLRDYVSIGRQIVCKVLYLDRERGHIDLSLRRVNSTQRREKLDEIKQELKAESLVKNLAKKLNKPVAQLYQQMAEKVFKEYSHLYLCFRDVVSGDVKLEKMGIEDKVAQEFTQAILDKFKPDKISIQGEIRLKTYHADGVEKIKDVLSQIEKVSPKISLSYLGAGRYKLIIEDVDYAPAEENLEEVLELIDEFNDKLSTAEFNREKND
ncbi:MAG: S1 RNA-binding domain-containing protein [Nanoarchaeota archaeon]|nr:S1 RNA-binding domain-containing protein [Nanoarchaeota archaeon]